MITEDSIRNKLLPLLKNDPTLVECWLNTKVLVLGEKSPKELIEDGRGDIVEALIEEIQSGFCR